MKRVIAAIAAVLMATAGCSGPPTSPEPVASNAQPQFQYETHQCDDGTEETECPEDEAEALASWLEIQKAQQARALSSVSVAAVIRKGADGNWFVLNNATHAPENIRAGAAGVDDMGSYLRVYFDQTFPKVGAVLVTPDETFGALYSAGSSVGLAYFNMYIFNKDGEPVTPAQVIAADNGNFWVTGTMWQ